MDMPWYQSQFPGEQPYSPHYPSFPISNGHSHDQYNPAAPAYLPQSFQSVAFPNSNGFAAPTPTSPAAPPPPPHWTGFLATGAPNPMVPQLANTQSSAFNYMAPPPSINTSSRPAALPPQPFHPNHTTPIQQRKNQKQKKTSHNTRTPSGHQPKNANTAKGYNEEARPHKKARINPPKLGETLNQSMQRIGSVKTAKGKQGAKAGKKSSVEPMDTTTNPSPGMDVPHVLTDNTAPHPSQERDRLKHFLEVLHANSFRFDDLVREGLDPTFLSGLYHEAGIDVTAQPAIDGSSTVWHGEQVEQDGDDDAYEPSDELDVVFDSSDTGHRFNDAGAMVSQEPPGASITSAPDQSQPPPISRENYLARLKAVRTGQSLPNEQTTIAGNLTLPQEAFQPHKLTQGTPSTPHEVSGIATSNDDLARAKDKARKAFAASRAARKAREPSPPQHPSEPDEVMQETPQPVETVESTTLPPGDQSESTLHSHPVQRSLEEEIPTPRADPSSFAVPEASRLPGLFMDPAVASLRPTPDIESNIVDGHATTRPLDREIVGPSTAQIDDHDDAEERVRADFEDRAEQPSAVGRPSSEKTSLTHATDEARADDFIRFGEGEYTPFAGFQRSAEPKVSGLTSISRSRPPSATSARPATQSTPPWNSQWKNSQSQIEDMKRKIQLAELKARVKAKRTVSPGTPLGPDLARTQHQNSSIGPDRTPFGDLENSHIVSASVSDITPGDHTNTKVPKSVTPASFEQLGGNQHQTIPVNRDKHEPVLVHTQPTPSKLTESPPWPSSSDTGSHGTNNNSARRSQRRAEIQSLLGESKLESESDLSRMAVLKAQLQELEDQTRRKREANERLVEELESLGVDTEHIPTEQLQLKRDEAVASLNTDQNAHMSVEYSPQQWTPSKPPQLLYQPAATGNQSGSSAKMDVPRAVEQTYGDAPVLHASYAEDDDASSTSSSDTSDISSTSSDEPPFDSEQQAMEIDSGSEGEIVEGVDNSAVPVQSSPQEASQTSQQRHSFPPSVFPEVQPIESHMQQDEYQPSPDDDLVEMELEGSEISPEGQGVPSGSMSSEEGEYTPEPSMPVNPSPQAHGEYEAVSISSDESDASEEYEPAGYELPQSQHDSALSNSDIPESDTESEEEEDYEPPDASMEPADDQNGSPYASQNIQHHHAVDSDANEDVVEQGANDDIDAASDLESGERSSSEIPLDVDSLTYEP